MAAENGESSIQEKLDQLAQWNEIYNHASTFDMRELAGEICAYLDLWLEDHDIAYRYHQEQGPFVEGKID